MSQENTEASTLLAVVMPAVISILGLPLTPVFAQADGGVARLIIEAGAVVYIPLLLTLITAVVNSILLYRLSKGSDLPPATLLIAPALVWIFGTGGAALGFRNCEQAVAMVNPGDKLTILMAGASESLANLQCAGLWASFAALGIALGLALISKSRNAPNRSLSGLGLGGFGAIAAVFAGMALTQAGGTAMPLLLISGGAAAAFALAGGSAGDDEASTKLAVVAALAAALAVWAGAEALRAHWTAQVLLAGASRSSEYALPLDQVLPVFKAIRPWLLGCSGVALLGGLAVAGFSLRGEAGRQAGILSAAAGALILALSLGTGLMLVGGMRGRLSEMIATAPTPPEPGEAESYDVPLSTRQAIADALN